jgi:hypothetical protein
MAGWLTQHVQGYALNSILEITLPVKSFTARIVAASPPDEAGLVAASPPDVRRGL